MSENNISEKEIDAARLFFQHAIGLNDITLLVLKGHLVLEEITRKIIDEKLPNPEALDHKRISCSNAICLAESLCDKNSYKEIWPVLKKINKLRNNIAHNLDSTGVMKSIDDINKSWKSGLVGKSSVEMLFMTLFSLSSILTTFLQGNERNIIKLFDK